MTKISVVLPVYNEEKDLPVSAEKLRAFLSENVSDDWEIVIADNGSSDATPDAARELSEKHPQIRHLRLEEKGRGRALKRAWGESDADIMCYMDIDLSTGLDALPKLISALKTEGYDIAIGSRFTKGAKVERSLVREILSRGYNYFIRFMLGFAFLDAQCGFKGITRKTAGELLPKIENNEWFFDTELLYRAQKKGLKVKEIPVEWVEDKDSRVRLVKTVTDYVKLTLSLRLEFLRRK